MSFKERRGWFDKNFNKVLADLGIHESRFTCPCCGLPTLPERGFFEICDVCDWEDDGQDDEDAGEVLGGPNSDYSLAEGRSNFEDHLSMYRKGDLSDGASEIKIKKGIAKAFDEFPFADSEKRRELFRLIDQGYGSLRSIVDEEVADYRDDAGAV